MHTNFYMAMTALIPILVLAISLQSSFFIRNTNYQSPNDDSLRNLYAMTITTVLAILIGAECLALRALYYDTSRSGWALMLSVSTGIAALFIIVDFLLALLNKSKQVGLYFFFLLLVALIALIAIQVG